jgi:hypothetical protein
MEPQRCTRLGQGVARGGHDGDGRGRVGPVDGTRGMWMVWRTRPLRADSAVKAAAAVGSEDVRSRQMSWRGHRPVICLDPIATQGTG